MRRYRGNPFKEGRRFLAQRRTIIARQLKEALASVTPITVIVLLLCFTIAPIPNNALIAFIFGAVLITLGFALFTLGAETAMTPFGERVGSHITKTRKVWVIAVISLIIGILITASEPDLQVLANQVPNIDRVVLITSVALGVGLFLVIAMLRILFAIRLSYLLFFFYTVMFVLAFFVPESFIAVAFDSGGVTTGPMTVPFIMALGMGVAFIRSDRGAESDSFGLVAMCSMGPIIAVMLLSFFYRAGGGEYVPPPLPDAQDSAELGRLFLSSFPHYFAETAVALLPIVVFFFIFTFFAAKQPKSRTVKTVIGFLYTYIGLVLFLTGVNAGFMPVGNYLGRILAQKEANWIIVPLAMLIGYFIVAAEPAVQVLNRRVEEITSGAISSRLMRTGLSAGVALSLGLAMVRVLTGIPIMWFLIPGYLIALVLTFFVPDIFTSIAFDSGGVASGPMTVTFLLPFAIGAGEATGADVVTTAFGLVAMVAMTPLITIQVLGLYYKIKTAGKLKSVRTEAGHAIGDDEDIIEL